jgi:hypothetical protein
MCQREVYFSYEIRFEEAAVIELTFAVEQNELRL